MPTGDAPTTSEWSTIFLPFNTLRPRQNGRHFADYTFKRIFMNENVRILIDISLKFVPKGLINKISALFQIVAWRPSADKPLSEPMMVNLLTHICVTRPQWVKMCLILEVWQYAWFLEPLMISLIRPHFLKCSTRSCKITLNVRR